MSLEIQLTKAENDLQAAKTKFVTGWIIFGGAIVLFCVSAAAMDSGAGGGAWLFLFISLAIGLSGLSYSGDNGAAAQEKIEGLKVLMQREKRGLVQREKEFKEAIKLMEKGGVENLNKAIRIFEKVSVSGELTFASGRTITGRTFRRAAGEAKAKLAGELEGLLRYKEAIDIWEELGRHSEAKRIRKKVQDEGRVMVDQTVVHGDYVDDRDTIVKDSVISKSNIGGGSSKMQELKDLTEMKEKGLIDDDEFRQMKKEILGK